ncbi:MAG TPA: glycosyl hydrolase family 18 protein [Candidatus Saccharimonadia bacterium]|nr:glycosyl hydrolase family 18 protein [Candidatus Saccharimonadia bacterium]
MAFDRFHDGAHASRMRQRPVVLLALVVGVVAIVTVVAVAGLGVLGGDTPAGPTGGSTGGSTTAEPTATPRPTARPIPGHEVYGYIPYWEMDSGIASHVADVDLSTIALFSVTVRRDGTINTSARGYKRITDTVGKRLVREAHDRGVRIEVVFSSFGAARNERFFGGPIETQDTAIDALVAFAKERSFDGINVDVETLDRSLVAAYGAFVGRLRDRLRSELPKGQVSAATGANVIGSEMAAAAAGAGADRIFLMGYDYHWSGSDPGASAPLDRRDGDEKDLVWSLDMYEAIGVPVERTLLGLPFYGMAWPVSGPEIGAPRTGRGSAWVPADNRAFLRKPPVEPQRDEIEAVDVYIVPTDPVAAQPTSTPEPGASVDPGASPSAGAWRAIYVDSPETLTPKMRLANDRGLAGVGFWAIGMERGLPGYQALIDAFRRDELAAP